MATFRLTKKFSFEMAHALPNYAGDCRNLHGHSYKLSVTVKGETTPEVPEGMVMDFHALKVLVEQEILDDFDHALVLQEDAYQPDLMALLEREFPKVIWSQVPPTTENILHWFVDRLHRILPADTCLQNVTLQETDNSFAEWDLNDNIPDIQNILFDLGGVIYDIRYENVGERFKSYGFADFEKKYSKFYQTDAIDKFEEGKISIPEFRAYIRSISETELTDAQIDDAWNAILIDIPQERVSLLEKVKKHYGIYLFSNTNELNYNEFYPKMKQKFGYDIFSELFRKSYFSNFLQIKKPKLESFQKILSNERLSPSETLFIDDSVQHIAGARQAGMHAYHLKKGESLLDLFDENGKIKPCLLSQI